MAYYSAKELLSRNVRLLRATRALTKNDLTREVSAVRALALRTSRYQAQQKKEDHMTPISYPPTRAVDQADDYHGTRVPDRYRWLEQTDAPETAAWIAAQNEVTFGYLAGIPAREPLRARLTELWDYARASAPVRRGGRYFQLRNTGLQNQPVLFAGEGLGDAMGVLLDPNALSEDGTIALSSWSASEDGRWLAYAVSASGSDWLTWRVRDVATGADLPDLLEWSKFSGAAWRADGAGFYYARYAAPTPGEDFSGVNYNQQLFYHQLGDRQADDRQIYHRPDQKEWIFSPVVSEDGRYLVIHVGIGTDPRNRVFYQDLASGGPIVELIGELEAAYHFAGNDGTLLYFQTDLAAPRGRLIAIDLADAARERWRTIIAERDDVLEGITLAHDQWVAIYQHDAHHTVERFNRAGSSLGQIALPTLGSVGLSGPGRRTDAELFYEFSSFLYPGTVFRYDFARGASEVIFAPALDFDTSAYETRQVFVASRDGTRVPMFLTHRRDLRLDGQNPTLLYGYGGFSISLTPWFDVANFAWLERGGVYASANLRGGGEYGEEWHQAGTLERKQHVFDDFIACAEWLIAERITSTPRLAINGGSNGGLLVGACMTQRPDLFGACVPQVGVMDMLRFHRFTIGWAWVSDFGSSDDPAQFQALYAYSPLHRLSPGTRYPATLITTADHDDRVLPGHSFKFAAALQAAQAGDAPVLIRIQANAGHGAGTPTTFQIAEAADMLAFLVEALDME
jgi:prolyl oligopeptidase